MLNGLTDVPSPDVPGSEDVRIAFHIGNMPIMGYAIFIMIGFILAIFAACMKMWKRYKIPVEPFYGFVLIGVPCSIFGARFGSCAIGDAPGEEFFNFRNGGLAIEGGVMLTVIAAFIYFPLVLKLPRYRVRDAFGPTPEVKKVSFGMYADAVIPCILIGQFLGRGGNYFNQEVYGGIVTDEGLANGLREHLPGMGVAADGQYHQPLFLGEGIGNIIMFFVLYFGIEFIPQRKAGDMAAGYFIGYGSFRCGLETLREAEFTFAASYVVSALFIAAGVAYILINHLLLVKYRHKKVGHTFVCNITESGNSVMMPKKISRLERKLGMLRAENGNPEEIAEVEKKLKEKKDYGERLQFNYQAKDYRASFDRTPAEMIYYGKG